MKNLNPELVETIQNIKLIVFDFDGVFTDNSVLVDQNGIESVRCSRSDGLGLRKLDDLNIKYCILSTEKNPVVGMRGKKLGIDVIQGQEDKLKALKEIIKRENFSMPQIAYVGNDINDLTCLEVVGLPMAVADSYSEVLAIVKYTSSKFGGHGAVREVCDLFYELLS